MNVLTYSTTYTGVIVYVETAAHNNVRRFLCVCMHTQASLVRAPYFPQYNVIFFVKKNFSPYCYGVHSHSQTHFMFYLFRY